MTSEYILERPLWHGSELVQGLAKGLLAIDGFIGLWTYLCRDSLNELQPLPHARYSAWCFIALNGMDIVAHAHRSRSYTMFHHLSTMFGCLLCLMVGGFAPSIVRMILVLESAGPWYKFLSLAKRLKQDVAIIWCLSMGVIVTNFAIRLPFVIWLAYTLLQHLRTKMTMADTSQPITTWLWSFLLAYCPLTVYLDSKWNSKILRQMSC